MCANEVADSCFRRLKGAGWDHTAWREAYVLAQLCCAALEEAAARQHHDQLGQGPSHPPGNGLTGSQPGAAPSDQEQADGAAGAQAAQQHALAALAAVDMASVLGAPTELTCDFIYVIEPLARALCPAEAAEVGSCNLGELETPGSPLVDSSRAIVRVQADELTRQSFREQLWKLDKPAIIKGLLQLLVLPVAVIDAEHTKGWSEMLLAQARTEVSQVHQELQGHSRITSWPSLASFARALNC